MDEIAAAVFWDEIIKSDFFLHVGLGLPSLNNPHQGRCNMGKVPARLLIFKHTLSSARMLCYEKFKVVVKFYRCPETHAPEHPQPIPNGNAPIHPLVHRAVELPIPFIISFVYHFI